MRYILHENRKIYPSKVICIGRNYVEHIKELDNEIPENMVIFNKPNSAISSELSFIDDDTRFEGEICFLMKDNKIDAVGFGLDLTKAKLQNYLKDKGLPWERAKGFNKSAVFSDFISFFGDISNLKMELFINSTLIQEANYDLMIYKPDDLVREISTFMDFEDGDIIMSGTPKGVGNYKVGDIFLGKIYDGDKLLLEYSWSVI
jgi:2-keto-4-pentenoate hydratase/2-oxohepta-3-ene-1,7-dioic acid hydratase in catechol pathway